MDWTPDGLKQLLYDLTDGDVPAQVDLNQVIYELLADHEVAPGLDFPALLRRSAAVDRTRSHALVRMLAIHQELTAGVEALGPGTVVRDLCSDDHPERTRYQALLVQYGTLQTYLAGPRGR